jgi:serine/threonine protein kinase
MVGKYVPRSELGVGAMGAVYLCSQPGLERPVAVKVMIAGRHASREQILRFQREAWAAAQLSHPNVLQIYDVGSDGALNYFVMEYVDGRSLDELIGSAELTLQRSLRLVAQVASALQAAHARGIIHRDIKPSNILINQEGQPKLADFGLAKSLHDSLDLSGSGDIIGTPRYMSPEQALAGPGEIDHRTDLYSLGAVMYEMLTGCPQVDGSNPLAILRQLIDENPVPVRQRNSAVPEEVATICERAIARDKEARFASAAELAEAIESFLAAHPDWDGSSSAAKVRAGPLATLDLASLSPASLLSLPRPWSRRRTLAAVLGGGLSLSLIGLAVLSPARSYLGMGVSQETADEEPSVAPDAAPSIPDRVKSVEPRRTAKPAGKSAKQRSSAVDPTTRALAAARELLQSAGSPSLARASGTRDRFKSLLEDLSSVLKSTPNNAEVRYLRGSVFRRAGEPSSAILDLAQVLKRDPKNLDARAERLLAGYQLYVLYMGNLNEQILRPIPIEHLEEDLRILLQAGDPGQRHLARMIEALARQDYEKAGKLAAEPTPPGVTSEDLADFQMVEADALFHVAEEAHRAEGAAAASGSPEPEKDRLRQARQALARKALAALRLGLTANPNHIGLLFLKADTLQRIADWETTDDDEQSAGVGRQRLAFDAALDRLRETALIGGCDHAIARAMILFDFGRESLALDRVNDALSCQPQVPYVHTFKAWLRLMAPSDGLLTAEEITRILNDFQAAFDHPDDFNSYFVRALLLAATSRWEEARSDLRTCRRMLAKLGRDSLPTSVSPYNNWLAQASTAPPTRYVYTTSDMVAKLPVVDDLKIRLAETVLKRLDNPQLVQSEGIRDDELKNMKGWTHYRLAVSYAARNEKRRVLEHVKAALELHRPDLTSKTFRNDASVNQWNNDPEFNRLYEQYDKS